MLGQIKLKTMQKNWIGKSFGCEINFEIEGDLPVKNIKCFTTRPDTLFGFSFLSFVSRSRSFKIL